MRQSARKDDALWEDFKAAGGVEVVRDLVLESVVIRADEKVQSVILSVAEDLLYVSDVDLIPSIAERPFQQPDDARLPAPTKAPLISSMEVVRMFQEVLEAEPSTGQLGGAGGADGATAALAGIKEAMLTTLMESFRANPINFFIANDQGLLGSLVARMEGYPVATQTRIAELITYVCNEVDYIPVAELSALVSFLNGTYSAATTNLVCDLFLELADCSGRFKKRARSIGIISGLSNLLRELAGIKSSKADAGSPESPDREAVVDDASTMKVTITETLLAIFDKLMRICGKVIELPDNASAFRRMHGGALFDLLERDDLRQGLLYVIKELLRDSGLAPSPASSISSTEIAEFPRLIEVLHSAPKGKVAMKSDILQAIKYTLANSPNSRATFREYGGFVSLVSILITLEGFYLNGAGMDEQSPASQKSTWITDEATVEAVTELIRLTFDVLITAIKDYDQNRTFFHSQIGFGSIEDAIRLTGILTTKNSIVAFGGLLGLAVEDNMTVTILIKEWGEQLDQCTREIDKGRESLLAQTPLMGNEAAKIANLLCLPTAILEHISRPTTVLQNSKAVISALKLIPHI
ncbi:WD repeat and FYVE domain-containing protein 3, partial [Irineochytrium annulatum]